MKTSILGLTAAATILLGADATGQVGFYDILDLGTFGTSPAANSNATGMNEQGHVVGLAEDDDFHNHAFLYRDGEFIDLGYLPHGGEFANAKGVNDLDQVVGQASAKVPDGPGYTGRPFVWTEGQGMLDPTPENFAYGSWCWGINNSGQLALTLDGAYFWDPVSGLRQILLPGAASSFGSNAWEINNSGFVCGSGTYASGPLRSFRYDSANDSIENLHDPVTYLQTEGYGINERGDIAGWGLQWDNYKPPVVWTIDGRTIVLPIGDLGFAHVLGQAEHINDKGTVVGLDVSGLAEPPIGWVAYDVLNADQPVKHDLRSVLSAADQLAWTRMHPFEVNEAGQICGTGTVNGSTRAFLMTPKDTFASATVRNGTGINPLVFENVSLPAQGGTWQARIDTSAFPGATNTAVLVFTAGLDAGFVLPLGELLISGVELFTLFAPPSGGVADYALPIPTSVALSGYTLTTQAAVQAGGAWQACNAIDWVVGAATP